MDETEHADPGGQYRSSPLTLTGLCSFNLNLNHPRRAGSESLGRRRSRGGPTQRRSEGCGVAPRTLGARGQQRARGGAEREHLAPGVRRGLLPERAAPPPLGGQPIQRAREQHARHHQRGQAVEPARVQAAARPPGPHRAGCPAGSRARAKCARRVWAGGRLPSEARAADGQSAQQCESAAPIRSGACWWQYAIYATPSAGQARGQSHSRGGRLGMSRS